MARAALPGTGIRANRDVARLLLPATHRHATSLAQLIGHGRRGWCGRRVRWGDRVAGRSCWWRGPVADLRGEADQRRPVSEASPDGVLIRTPDQRLRVFVSSTLGELARERRAVWRVISALGLTRVLFELGARPHPPRDLYRAYLAQSDVFIGLYWQRYGWIGPGMDISGLEDEFRLSEGMPRLLYLKSPAPEQEPRLAAMIADIQSAGADSYRTFASTRELGRLVGDDLALLLSERFVTAAPAARSLAPAAATEARPPRRSLPTPSTSLVGREDDISELSSLLTS